MSAAPEQKKMSDDEWNKLKASRKLKKEEQKKAKRAKAATIPTAPTPIEGGEFECTLCHLRFGSRNQLFMHLKRSPCGALSGVKKDKPGPKKYALFF